MTHARVFAAGLALGIAVLTLWAGGGTSASAQRMNAKIAFSRGNINVGTAIWTVNGDGSELVQITHPPRSARDNQPQWSPDRGRIAFVRAVVVGENFRGDPIRREHLKVMNANGSALRRLAVHARDPVWSPNGALIAFVKNHADDEWVWIIKPDGSGARRLARGAHPAWSPNGRTIAFTRYLGGISLGEVFLMNSDGSGQHRLLATKYESQSPSWAPDGRRMAFLGYSDHGLYVVRASGRGVTRLTGGVSSKDSAEPHWSPDGSKLLFERGAGGTPDSTFVIDSTGRGLRRVATSTDYPTWSPDGRSIAFARLFRDLRVVSATGGPARRLAGGDSRDIDW